MNRLSVPLYDCHTHTHRSHDSRCLPEDSCRTALELGLGGISFTDHCDVEYLNTFNELTGSKKDIFALIEESLEDAKECRARFNTDTFKVLRGVEMGEAIWHLPEAEHFLHTHEFDIVVGSVHAATGMKPYSGIHFDTLTPLQIDAFLQQYFRDIHAMLEQCDFDVLAHLICPFRYIVGRYHMPVDLAPYRDSITSILKKAIDRDLGFEVNTSNFQPCADPHQLSAGAFFMPLRETVQEYLALGGNRIVMASDAHAACNIAKGFEVLREELLRLGVTHCYYYENRRPKAYPLEQNS